jgi:hypothetical protein
MKTRITQLVSVMIVLALVLSGCRKGGDYVNVLPKDAYGVVSVDLKSIVEKCGLSDNENTRIQQILNDMVSGGLSAETQKEVTTIISSPSETGIDFKSPIYLFASPTYSNAAFLMHVADSKKLKSTLETFAKENICQQLGESGGYTFTVMGSDLLMFSKSALVVVPFSGHSAYEELKDGVAALLGQGSSDSFASGKAFDKLNSRSEDVKYYVEMKVLGEPLAQQMMVMNGDVDMSQLAILGGLNFGKGDISMQMVNYTENSEMESLLKKQSKAAETISRDYLEYFPKSTMAFASIGVDGKKYYEILADNDQLVKLLPFISTETGKAIINSFDGDVSVGMTGMSMSGVPTILAYAKVKNSKMLDAIYEGRDFFLTSGMESIEKQGKNQFIYKSKFPSVTLYYGVKKKNLYATNDKQLFDDIFKESKPSFEDNEFVKDIKGKSFFAVVNVKEILEMPMLKMMLGMGNAEIQMYYNLASKLDYVEISATPDGVANYRIVLADRQTNSLRQIVDLVGATVGLQ